MHKFVPIFLTAVFFYMAFGLDSQAHAGGIFAAVVGAVAAAFKSATVVAALTKIGVSLALTGLQMMLAKKPSQGGGISTKDNKTGEANPQSVIFGRYPTAGAWPVYPYVGDTGAKKKPNQILTYVVDLADHPTTELEGVWVYGDYYEIAWDQPSSQYGYKLTAPGNDGVDAYVWFHNGTQTEANPMMVSLYGNHHTNPWTNKMVGHGVSYAVITHVYDMKRYSGFPDDQLFVLKGAKLFDPRKSTLAGGVGPHVYGQPETYEYTENPVVMIYNLLRGLRMPDGSVYGLHVQQDKLPINIWFAAMNACDEYIDGEPRYRASYEFTVDQEPLDVIEEIAKTAAGRLVEFGGFYGITVGAPTGSLAHITDQNVILDEKMDYTMFASIANQYNTVKSSYPDPANGWQETDAVRLSNPDWIVEDDGREYTAELNLPACPYPKQVRRLMREALSDNRRQRQHTLTLPFEYLYLEPGDTISWTSPHNGYSAKLFEIDSKTIDPESLHITIGIRERDNEDYNIDVISDSIVPTFPNTRPQPPIIIGYEDIEVQGVALTDEQGRARRAAILFTWEDTSVPYEIQYEIRSINDTVANTITDLSGGYHYHIEGILPQTQYDVRYRITNSKLFTDFGEWITVLTPDAGLTKEDLDQEIIDEWNAITEITDNILDDIEEAKQIAGEAAQDAQTAITNAANAITHADTIVQQARDDLAVDYASAEQAVTDALAAAQDAGDYAIEARSDRIAAEAASGLAEGYKDQSFQSATNAGESAGLAQQAAGIATNAVGLSEAALEAVRRAMSNARTLLPTIPTPESAAFSLSANGTPPVGEGSYGSDEEGPYVARSAATAVIYTRGSVPAGDGRVYRVTAKFSLAQEATVRFQAVYRNSDDTANIASGSPAPEVLPAGVHTKTMIIGRYAGGLVDTVNGGANWANAGSIRFGATALYNPAAQIKLYELRIEDLTEADQAKRQADAAANSADAAYHSEQTAGSHANDAGSSAFAANQSKLEAQAAAGDAEDNATQAGVYRNDAVTAAQEAEDAAASAQSNLLLTAEVAGRGISCLNDTFLLSSDWGVWVGQGTRTLLDNAIYPIGRTWQFELTEAQRSGIQLLNSPETIWKGQTDADAYVIEVEYTLVSGSLQGAGVGLVWRNSTSNNFSVQIPLADMTPGTGIAGRARVARAVFVKPANFTGTFASHNLYAFANWDGWDMAAKTIQFHRINIRAASEEELGRGVVGAYLEENYFTRAETDQAIANADLTLNASLGDTFAKVNRADTAIASLNGNVARTRNMVTVDGVNYAGLEAVAFDGEGTPSGTALMLYGDQVIVPGSLSAREVVVHDGSGNLFPDPQFIGLSLAGWRRVNGQPSYAGPMLATDLPGATVRQYAPAPAALRFSNHSGQGHFVIYGPVVEASAGNIFNLGFNYSVAGNGTHVHQLRLGWIDNTGAVFSRDALTANAAPAMWEWFETDVEAPAGTVAAQIEIVSLDNGTMTQWSAATNYIVIRKRAGATLITPNSITTDEVNSESLMTGFAGIDQAFINDAHIAGKLNARNISLVGINNGFSAGKESLNDPSDGMYFGRGANGQFGFSMSRESSAGIPQAMRLTQNEGINILNARFTLTGSATSQPVTLTTNQTVSLPAGSQSISLVLVGGGGGGHAAGRDGPGSTTGTNGEASTVRLLDGSSVVQTWTASGGAAGGHVRGKGEDSPLGNGGHAGGGLVGWYPNPGGAGVRGAGGGGGGNAYSGGLLGFGGAAGQTVEVVDLDVSGLANPRLEFIRGAGGSGGGANGEAYSRGGNGGPGAVRYRVQAYTETPADVLPLLPTATGSFVKTHNQTGNNVFPNLGAGMWHIFTTNNSNLDIGTIELTSLGHTVRVQVGTSAMFIANKRPVVTAGVNEQRTIHYHFYRMGDWG